MKMCFLRSRGESAIIFTTAYDEYVLKAFKNWIT